MRNSFGLFFDHIVQAEFARKRQDLVPAISIRGVGGPDKVHSNFAEQLPIGLTQIPNRLEEGAQHVAHLWAAGTHMAYMETPVARIEDGILAGVRAYIVEILGLDSEWN